MTTERPFSEASSTSQNNLSTPIPLRINNKRFLRLVTRLSVDEGLLWCAKFKLLLTLEDSADAKYPRAYDALRAWGCSPVLRFKVNAIKNEFPPPPTPKKAFLQHQFDGLNLVKCFNFHSCEEDRTRGLKVAAFLLQVISTWREKNGQIRNKRASAVVQTAPSTSH